MDPLIDPWSCDGSQPSGGRLRWEHLLPIKNVSQPDGHDIYLEETMHVDPRLFRDVERVEPAGGGLKVPGSLRLLLQYIVKMLLKRFRTA